MIPAPAGAGFMASVTGAPVCNALPLSDTSRKMVLCFMGFAQCQKAGQKGKPGDHAATGLTGRKVTSYSYPFTLH
jgi:hypothetical protein